MLRTNTQPYPTMAALPPPEVEALHPELARQVQPLPGIPDYVQAHAHQVLNRHFANLLRADRAQQDPTVMAALAGQPDPAMPLLARYVIGINEGVDHHRNLLALFAAASLAIGAALTVTKASIPAGNTLLILGGIGLLAIPTYDWILQRRVLRRAQEMRAAVAGLDNRTEADPVELEMRELNGTHYDAVAPDSPHSE